jgi:hypothetical protein
VSSVSDAASGVPAEYGVLRRVFLAVQAQGAYEEAAAILAKPVGAGG